MMLVSSLFTLTYLKLNINYFSTILSNLDNFAYLNERITELTSICIHKLKKQGFSNSQLHTEPFLHLRYDGTDCAIMCSASNDCVGIASTVHGDFLSGFLARYAQYYVHLHCLLFIMLIIRNYLLYPNCIIQ